MSKELQRKRSDRSSDAIVFNGPTNIDRTDGVIHFPTDDGKIDFSRPVTPSSIDTNTMAETTPLQLTSGTFANCGVVSQNGTEMLGSANTGVFTYPNGTQAIYSKCVVVHIIKG